MCRNQLVMLLSLIPQTPMKLMALEISILGNTHQSDAWSYGQPIWMPAMINSPNSKVAFWDPFLESLSPSDPDQIKSAFSFACPCLLFCHQLVMSSYTRRTVWELMTFGAEPLCRAATGWNTRPAGEGGAATQTPDLYHWCLHGHGQVWVTCWSQLFLFFCPLLLHWTGRKRKIRAQINNAQWWKVNTRTAVHASDGLCPINIKHFPHYCDAVGCQAFHTKTRNKALLFYKWLPPYSTPLLWLCFLYLIPRLDDWCEHSPDL